MTTGGVSASDCSHLMLAYGSEQALVSRVTEFLIGEAKMGRHVAAVANAEHTAQFVDELKRQGFSDAQRRISFTFIDAAIALSKILVSDYPDEECFEEVIGDRIRAIACRSDISGVSAYGEMVGLLWQAKQFPAAVRLEQLWNALLARVPFRLFCSYPIDPFSDEFDAGVLGAILCAHRELLPFDSTQRLSEALDIAVGEVLGKEHAAIQDLHSAPPSEWGTISPTEATLLRLRQTVPEHANEILARTRQHYASTS